MISWARTSASSSWRSVWTPIKPALSLGAERVIVIALNSVAPSRAAPPEHQPDFYVGAAHLLHAALGDPLAQDIRTLANTNALIGAGRAATQRTVSRPPRGAPGAARRPLIAAFAQKKAIVDDV